MGIFLNLFRQTTHLLKTKAIIKSQTPGNYKWRTINKPPRIDKWNGNGNEIGNTTIQRAFAWKTILQGQLTIIKIALTTWFNNQFTAMCNLFYIFFGCIQLPGDKINSWWVIKPIRFRNIFLSTNWGLLMRWLLIAISCSVCLFLISAQINYTKTLMGVCILVYFFNN